MPTFHYRALTVAGEVVSGDLEASSATEVAHRVAYLGLIPSRPSPSVVRRAPSAKVVSPSFRVHARKT
jgi:type II secretory pathway component PulF